MKHVKITYTCDLCKHKIEKDSIMYSHSYNDNHDEYNVCNSCAKTIATQYYLRNGKYSNKMCNNIRDELNKRFTKIKKEYGLNYYYNSDLDADEDEKICQAYNKGLSIGSDTMLNIALEYILELIKGILIKEY